MTKAFPIFVWALGALLLLAMTSCSNFVNHLPPCTTADCSVHVVGVSSTICPLVSNFPRNLYQVSNTAGRNVIVDVQGVVNHNNQPPLNISSYELRRRVPSAQAGNNGTVDMGCQYEPVLNNDIWDEYQFSIERACFEGDPGCPTIPTGPTPIVAAPQPPSQTCVTACNAPDCIEQTVPSGTLASAAQAAAKEALSVTYNATVDLVALLPGMQCTNRGPLKITGTDFREAGDSCKQYFNLLPVDPTRRLLASLPGGINGKVNRTGVQSDFIFPNAINAPGLGWYSNTDQEIGFEAVDRLIVTPGRLKIIGARRYCLWIDFGEGTRK